MKFFLLVWMIMSSDGKKYYGNESFRNREDVAVFIYRKDDPKLKYKLYELLLPEGKVREVKIPTMIFQD